MADKNNGTSNSKENSIYRPVFFGDSLSKQLLLRAKVELNETDENIKLGLCLMKEKVRNENLYLETDDILIKFLRTKKYNFKASFESYKNYLRLLEMCVKKLKIPDFETFKYATRMNLGTVLPYRDADDRAIIVYRLGAYRKAGLQSDDGFCTLLGLGFCLISDPATQIGGIAFIVDAKEMRFSDFPALFGYSRWLMPMIKGFPGRVRRIDIVNQPGFFGKLLSFVGPLMPSKIRDRLTCHGHNYESLLQNYGSSIMPSEYGGTLGPLNSEHLMERMEKCFSHFQLDAMTNYGIRHKS